MEQQKIDCPFCGYETDSEYQIMLHMETLHAEGGQSPFVVTGDEDHASIAAILDMEDRDVQYASCPVEGCGEAILFTEVESHIEMHGAEQQEQDIEDELEPKPKKPKLTEEIEAAFDTKLSYALRNLDDGEPSFSETESPPDRHASAKAAWKDLLKMPETKSSSSSKSGPSSTAAKSPRRRLGKSELGPHANEKQMPSWLVKLLESDGKLETINRLSSDGKLKKVKVCINQASGILPVLDQLLEQDPYTEYAYLCHPVVKHVSKLRGEGGFCGYRNIQMMCSYILGVESQGYENFNEKIPSIFQIQDYIEQAWDLGFNIQGRVETGGIRGTRKYIGTPDAQALFCSLGISCDAQGIKTKKDALQADQVLFQVAEAYFLNDCTDFDAKVRLTSLPPIYFQHPGHSMTIIGFEKKQDGSKNLIVFDPMFHDASNVLKLVGNDNFKHKAPEDLLKAYRRGVKYLRKYNEFEVLRLTPPEAQSGNVKKGSWHLGQREDLK